MKNRTLSLALAALLGGMLAVPASATLNPAGIWNGKVGLSVDAVGSNNSTVGNILAEIPNGSTILKAYLYSAGTPFPWYSNSPDTLAEYNSSGITLAGNLVDNFSKLVGSTAKPNRPDIGDWFTGRADVTALISSLVGAGPSYAWAITEGLLNTRIDGELLAIVYENAALPEGSVAILDGGQNTGGETTTVNFANPLGDVTDPNFVADMSLGISFSVTSSQVSQIDINGNRMSSSAGGIDDGVGSDGGLITAGGIGDTNANPANPNSNTSPDDELYDLKPFLTQGDTSFSIFTKNPSNDDNIFFMGLTITAKLDRVNDTPADPPTNNVPDSGSTFAMIGACIAALFAARRRMR